MLPLYDAHPLTSNTGQNPHNPSSWGHFNTFFRSVKKLISSSCFRRMRKFEIVLCCLSFQSSVIDLTSAEVCDQTLTLNRISFFFALLYGQIQRDFSSKPFKMLYSHEILVNHQLRAKRKSYFVLAKRQYIIVDFSDKS